MNPSRINQLPHGFGERSPNQEYDEGLGNRAFCEGGIISETVHYLQYVILYIEEINIIQYFIYSILYCISVR